MYWVVPADKHWEGRPFLVGGTGFEPVTPAVRVNTIITHLSPEEAITLIEFLDQVREVLMQTYGDDIKKLLQAASRRESGNVIVHDPPF